MLSALFALACTPAELPDAIPPSRVEPIAVPAPLPVPIAVPDGRLLPPSDDDSPIASTIRRYQGQIKWCYQQQLAVDPTLAGRLELQWAIGERGRVSNAKVVSNTTKNTELGTCAVTKLKRWTFPADTQGVARWPFVFAPAGK